MNRKALIFTGLPLLVLVLLASCKKGDDRPVRSDYITVYETSASKTVNSILVPFEGVTDGQIHVLSNVPLQWKYLVDEDEADWFTIKSVETPEEGHWVVTYDATSLLALNSLSRREGRLSFVCPEASFGKFMSVHQGYKRPTPRKERHTRHTHACRFTSHRPGTCQDRIRVITRIQSVHCLCRYVHTFHALRIIPVRLVSRQEQYVRTDSLQSPQQLRHDTRLPFHVVRTDVLRSHHYIMLLSVRTRLKR